MRLVKPNYLLSGPVEQASCLGMLDKTLSISCQDWELARIIHECRREAFEDRSPPGLLARKADGGVLAVRRGGEREKPRRARGSDVVAGIHE